MKYLCFLSASAWVFLGCALLAAPAPGVSKSVPPPAPQTTRPPDKDALSAAQEEEIIFLEEMDAPQDEAALAALISAVSAQGPSVDPPDTSATTAPVSPVLSQPSASPGEAFSGVRVPVAYETWQLTDDACMGKLTEAGIVAQKPDFDTPLVKTPLLLESPVEGVLIRARWPQLNRINEVMDCRLVVALIEVAREASRRGVKEISFYSTYRPLRKPDENCATGRDGKSCRKKKQAYEAALANGKASQHRRATGIDIRWFTMENGEVIDVLENYERQDGSPPCVGEPKTPQGTFLKELACSLHDQKIFNVMLTPNANEAHHNHFHFDITPDAQWYIIR